MAFSFSGLVSGLIEGVPRLLGKSSIKQRVMLGAAYAAPAWIGSKMIENFADQQRNYYGESRYNSYYGNGLDTVTGALAAGGILGAGLAAIDRDPISRARNSYRYHFAKERKLLRRTRNTPEYGGFGLRHPGRVDRSSPPRFSPSTGFTDRHYGSRISFLEGRLENLRRRPKLGIMSASILAAATGASPLNYFLNNDAANKVITGTAVGGASLVGGWAAYKMISAGGAGAIAATAAGGYVGYLAGSRHLNNTPEGNIIDFGAYNDAGVARMNFSTSGLTLALHNSNRKY